MHLRSPLEGFLIFESLRSQTLELKTYIIRRLLLLIPVLLGVTLLVFGLLQLISPTQRATLYATSARDLQNIDTLINKYNLDEPVYIQYGTWMSEVLHGNLGWSEVVSMPVTDASLQFLPATIELANSIDAILNWDGRVLLDSLRHLVLPVITLSAVQVALVMRIMRSSMLEALGKRYIVTAKAKGLSERDVMVKHAQPNALIPVVTVAGYIVALLMNGVVITETVFNYKGIGWWFWQSAINLDIAGVLGFTLFNGVVFVFINLIIDLIYMRIDPRVRLGAGI